MPSQGSPAPRRFRSSLRRAFLLLGPGVALALPAAGPALSRSPAADPPRAVYAPELEPLRRGSGGTVAEVNASFPLTLDGVPLRLRMAAFPVMPGQGVALEVVGAGEADLAYQDGSARAYGDRGWRWTAPQAPGAYALRVALGDAVVDLTALVLHPAGNVRNGVLRGYRIGEYRRTPLRGDPAYLPPEGFVEVAARDRDLLVSPRLTLGQFLCKQPGEPRLVAVSPALLVKLEAVMDQVEQAGHDPASLVVMSGFRTPAYNRAIGNTTSYSRHLWGDAADIYLDRDGDGDMDDLNGDGRADLRDARVLAALVEDAVADEPGILPGGLSVYRRNAAHGPFVHVDARGTRARW